MESLDKYLYLCWNFGLHAYVESPKRDKVWI